MPLSRLLPQGICPSHLAGRRYGLYYRCLVLAVFALTLIHAPVLAAQASIAPGSSLEVKPPRYRMQLNLIELSFIQGAAQMGANKFPGPIEMMLRLVNEKPEASWIVEINDETALKALDYGLSQRILALQGSIDNSAQPNAMTKVMLDAAKLTRAKIEFTHDHPTYDPRTLSGILNKVDSAWSLTMDSTTVRLDISALASAPASFVDRPVVVHGVVRKKNQLDLSHVIEVKENVLDLFVMSECPYGKRAQQTIVSSLSKSLSQAETTDAPQLQIHYIFFPAKTDSGMVLQSLHGETEVLENLVQMLIRDRHSERFWKYLLLRGESDQPWQALAMKAGISMSDVQRIDKLMVNQRQALIQKEYNTVAAGYAVYERSPTYIWQGQKVRTLNKVPFFSDHEGSASDEACVSN